MSEIINILSKLQGTHEAQVLEQMSAAYEKLAGAQKEWYKKSQFICPDGCGCCCHNFEPDLLDCEASYMAAWIIENKPEMAEKLAMGTDLLEASDLSRSQEQNDLYGKTCPFHDFENPYHCTIYEGRPFVCRMFGGCGNRDKEGNVGWKPCKFYPDEMLKKRSLEHRQYNIKEIKKIFRTVPPVMSDYMEEAVSINPDNKETKLLSQILPDTIRRLKWLINMNGVK